MYSLIETLKGNTEKCGSECLESHFLPYPLWLPVYVRLKLTSLLKSYPVPSWARAARSRKEQLCARSWDPEPSAHPERCPRPRAAVRVSQHNCQHPWSLANKTGLQWNTVQAQGSTGLSRQRRKSGKPSSTHFCVHFELKTKTPHNYLWMLAEPLKVEWYVIKQVVRVLIDQFLEGSVSTGLTDVPHGAQRRLAHQQCLLTSFLQHRIQRGHQQGTEIAAHRLSTAGDSPEFDAQLTDVAVELMDHGCRCWWWRNHLERACIWVAGITVVYRGESGWTEQLRKETKPVLMHCFLTTFTHALQLWSFQDIVHARENANVWHS